MVLCETHEMIEKKKTRYLLFFSPLATHTRHLSAEKIKRGRFKLLGLFDPFYFIHNEAPPDSSEWSKLLTGGRLKLKCLLGKQEVSAFWRFLSSAVNVFFV